MSDLQCAARLFVASPPVAGGATRADEGALTEEERRRVHALAEQLRPVRISTVCSSEAAEAVASAGVAGEDLDVATRVVGGLQGLAPGESDVAAVARFRDAVEEIADLHRGEDVLVFSHADVMALAIPRVAGNVRGDLAQGHELPPCVPVRVDVDADGWRLDSWPGLTGADADAPA